MALRELVANKLVAYKKVKVENNWLKKITTLAKNLTWLEVAGTLNGHATLKLCNNQCRLRNVKIQY